MTSATRHVAVKGLMVLSTLNNQYYKGHPINNEKRLTYESYSYAVLPQVRCMSQYPTTNISSHPDKKPLFRVAECKGTQKPRPRQMFDFSYSSIAHLN